ncbi:MAG: hypothetical protein R3279_07210, partial [Putridiphycobacter sp.]|nr:hypothetical protein [Putridiphycobacter sp.]
MTILWVPIFGLSTIFVIVWMFVRLYKKTELIKPTGMMAEDHQLILKETVCFYRQLSEPLKR